MGKATSIKPPQGFSDAVVERLSKAREIVFEAHSIAAVAAAAAVSEMPANEDCMETTLRLVSTMLNEVAALIEPVDLAKASADLRASHA